MLIQDFERLSLSDNSRSNNVDTQNHVVTNTGNLLDRIGVGIISVPKNVKKHVERLRSTGSGFNDERLIYEKLKEAVRSEHLQMICWRDPMQVAYQQWLDWIGARWASWPTKTYGNDNDYNYDYHFYDGYDSDIDMDT